MKVSSLGLASVLMLTANVEAHAEDLTYSGWLGTYAYLQPVAKRIKEKFEEQHKGVNFVQQDVPFEKALDQATVAFLGNNSADVVHLTPGWVPALQGIEALAPLDDLFTKDELAQIAPAALDALRFPDGKLYALPWIPGPVMLLYNRDLLQKAGFDPDAPPKTWDELKTMILAVCKLPEIDGGKTYGLALRSWSNPNAIQWTIPLIYGFGGDIVDAEGKIKFNTEATVKAYTWLQEISQAGCAPKGFSVGETRNLMSSGKAGFILEGPWGRGLFNNLSQNTIKTAKDGDIWVAALPPAPDGSRTTIGNSHVIAISSQSDKKELAADFIRLILFDNEITENYYKLSDQISTSSMPLLTSGTMGADEFSQKFVGQLSDYRDAPIKHPKFYAILDQVVPEFQKILGGADVAESLAQADAKIEKLLSR